MIACKPCTSTVSCACAPPTQQPQKTFAQGTLNIISVAQRTGVKKVVLVSSIGVDELLSPFNLFGGLAFWKKQAELALQRSGLDYTIVRPGMLL